MFQFEPISIYTCKKFLKELDPCKPLGPSETPALVLKDSISAIAEPLCFLITAFMYEGRFPRECKRAGVERYILESNFDFGKTLNWGTISCFSRYKMDSTQDLRIKHGIISVRQTLDMNAIKFFLKWK